MYRQIIVEWPSFGIGMEWNRIRGATYSIPRMTGYMTLIVLNTAVIDND
jgi:hypothetical protein